MHVEQGGLRFADLEPGEYGLKLTVMGAQDTVIMARDVTVAALEPESPPLAQVLQGLTPGAVADLGDYLGLISDSSAGQAVAPDTLDAANWIGATEDQRRGLISAELSRLAEIEGTDTARLLLELLRRRDYADRYFQHFQRPGLSTDRGRIFWRRGSPSFAANYPATTQSRAYWVWSYDRPTGEDQFAFVDADGVGTFTLVHGTGEAGQENANWRGLLPWVPQPVGAEADSASGPMAPPEAAPAATGGINLSPAVPTAADTLILLPDTTDASPDDTTAAGTQQDGGN